MFPKRELWLLNWGWLVNWILTGLAAFALVMALTCGYMTSRNRDLQQEIINRQAFLQNTPVLQSAHNDIISALMKLAIEQNDKEILELLAAQDITPPARSPGTANAQNTEAKP